MATLRKRQVRREILKQEIEDCHTILETAYIERDIALAVEEFSSLSDIGAQITAMLRRLKVLDQLLYKAEHPELDDNHKEDFIGWIVIKRGDT